MSKIIILLSMDGNQVCATLDTFECLAVDPAGFGDTANEAIIDLMNNSEVQLEV